MPTTSPSQREPRQEAKEEAVQVSSTKTWCGSLQGTTESDIPKWTGLVSEQGYGISALTIKCTSHRADHEILDQSELISSFCESKGPEFIHQQQRKLGHS